MEIKQLQSKKVFYTSLKATLQSLTNDVSEKPNQLIEDLRKTSIKETGPQEWVYYGSDGKPQTEFTLEICMPVEETQKGNPSFKILDGGIFAIETHKGPWSALGVTYQKMIQEIMISGKRPSGVSREVYHVCDFVNQENCITEVQIELLS